MKAATMKLDHKDIQVNANGMTLYRNTGKKNQLNANFDSVDSFTEFLLDDNDVHVNGRTDWESYTKSTAEDRWLGNTSPAQVLKDVQERTIKNSLARRIDEGAKLLDIRAEIEDFEQNGVYLDQTGITCDLGAYYAGEDDCMLNYDVVTTQRPTVWLAINTVCSASAPAANFINRGIAVANTISTLQANNINVGVLAYVYGRSTEDSSLTTVVVKAPDEALSMPLVTTAIANPAFFRALLHASNAKITGRTGYNPPKDKINASMFKHAHVDENNMIILNGDWTLANFSTLEKSEKFLIDTVNNHLKQQDMAA